GLRASGIAIVAGDEATTASLPDDCELVVASAAIRPEDPVLQSARERGLPVLSYAEAVGLAMEGRIGVSIAGTHGKSTTTSILAHCLLNCGLDPSFIAGARCPQLGGGWRVGAASLGAGIDERPGIFVAEACEFNRSFHRHRPTVALINNVEEDHLDFYASIDEIVDSFREFARLLPADAVGGRLLIGHEGAHRREICSGLECGVSTFGFAPGADYQVVHDAAAGRVGLLEEGALIVGWDTRLTGDHNALNAAAAGVLARWLGAEWSDIGSALGEFEGLDRRMQHLGSVATADGGAAEIVDDYGHHPSECEATLRALRTSRRPNRLICVFQPHQHSRTRFLLDQFAHAFTQADLVIVPEIFFVRDSEEERRRISAADLVDRLRSSGTTAMHIHPFAAIVEHLEEVLRDGDLVVVMGAGPVWQIAHDLVRRNVAGSGEQAR
ncbi:MAG: Mur ligase family protein, partial [Planctomycetota bacterium]|nr:Mur ligase family protein [Planctomycetota bacterium]